MSCIAAVLYVLDQTVFSVHIIASDAFLCGRFKVIDMCGTKDASEAHDTRPVLVHFTARPTTEQLNFTRSSLLCLGDVHVEYYFIRYANASDKVFSGKAVLSSFATAR